MIKPFFRFLSISLVFLFACRAERSVSAHGDEPRLEISPGRLNPGGVLDLRGVDFGLEEEITLALAGPNGDVSFGSVLSDTEGGFQLTLTLPTDLAEGIYVIRATTEDHMVESPPITVWGSADLGGGEARQEEDVLLAPMPTYAPGESTAQPRAAVPQERSHSSAPARPMAWLAAGLVLVAVLFLTRKAKR